MYQHRIVRKCDGDRLTNNIVSGLWAAIESDDQGYAVATHESVNCRALPAIPVSQPYDDKPFLHSQNHVFFLSGTMV